MKAAVNCILSFFFLFFYCLFIYLNVDVFASAQQIFGTLYMETPLLPPVNEVL